MPQSIRSEFNVIAAEPIRNDFNAASAAPAVERRGLMERMFDNMKAGKFEQAHEDAKGSARQAFAGAVAEVKENLDIAPEPTRPENMPLPPTGPKGPQI